MQKYKIDFHRERFSYCFVKNESTNIIFHRSEILGEVQTQGTTKLPSNKTVLVLGDNASGKTSLIAKLQGVEDPKKGSGLEYAYIDVRDEYRDGELIGSIISFLLALINI